MAVLCWFYFLVYLETALFIEHTNTTENINITLRDGNDTFSDRDESLHLTELEMSPAPSFYPDPTADLSESVTANPDQTESTDTSIPETKSELPRFATESPLPVSGVLPTPVTEVINMCPCNLQDKQCDINCCCDPDCREELSLFTDCLTKRISGDPRLCKQDTVVYSLSTTAEGLSSVQTSVQQEVNPDIFCIQSANYEKGMSFETPTIPTEENFDSLFGKFVGFFFGSSEDTSATQSPEIENSPGYLYGDVIQTVNEAGEQESFTFPASAGTAHCLDTNPAAFLKDQTSRCIRILRNVAQDCLTLKTLDLTTYISVNIRSGKNKDAKIIGVDIGAITVESLEGTWTPVDPAEGSAYVPLNSGDVCNNVVKQVKYIFRYSEAGEVVNAMASFLLGGFKKTTMSIQQEFQITFLQETTSTPGLRFSGNPGYVVGLPLVAGTRTADGIVQTANPEGSLTILQNSAEQDCLLGSSQRTPVLFGVNMISGCTLRISDAVNCSIVSEVLLWALKGQNFPDHVASFGNSLPQNPLDWVPIQNQTITSGTQTCSIPLSYHLEVKWTKYGTLVNPQAQVVSIMETILTNSSSLGLLNSAGGLVSVTTSVSFVDVSASASPGFKAAPTIDAKLPFDFFFPFV